MAGAVGHLLEWFDWSIYGLTASVFAAQFFVSTEPLVPLISAFAVYAVGFAMRPIGAIVLGSYADRAGRRQSLSISILIMAVSSLLIGLLPSYSSIGLLAPLLLLTARLAQGFSSGGEFGASAAFLVEYAGPGRRGLAGAFQQSTVGLGALAAAFLAALLSNLMAPEAFSSWGWRIPFIVGGLFGFYGLYLRKSIPDTPVFQSLEDGQTIAAHPVRETFTKYPRQVAQVIGLICGSTLTYYVWLNYMPTFANKVTGIPLATALTVQTIGLVVFVVALPFCGILADKVGRKPVMATFAIAMLIATAPLLNGITNTFESVLLVTIVGVFFQAVWGGASVTAMTELFPARIRTTGVSVPYSLTVALFGGTAPLIATYLVANEQRGLLPIYIMSLLVVVLLTIFTLPETRDRALT